MYVVSEITGKKYATVTECLEDEKRVKDLRKAEENARRYAEVWEKVVDAAVEFLEVSLEVDPEATEEDIVPLIQELKKMKKMKN